VKIIDSEAQQGGFLGITMNEISASDSRLSGYKHVSKGIGIEVVEVLSGQPASKFGINISDIIIAINSEGFKSLDDFRNRIINILPNTTITLTVIRGNATCDFQIVLSSRPEKYQYKYLKVEGILYGD
jgi:S1-C subfamily serine protease